MKQAFTHAQLVNVARKWLARRCVVVATELTCGASENPDAIGFRHDGFSILVECKASLADYRADSKKFYRAEPSLGMGAERYYLAPVGLVNQALLPEGWGLLVWDGRRVVIVREAGYFMDRNHAWEKETLISALRRLYRAGDEGVRVRCYTVKGKTRAKATLGIEPVW